MKNNLTPQHYFYLFNLAGLSLLFAFWLESGQTAGFFLLLLLCILNLLRLRVPKAQATIFLDMIVCFVLSRLMPSLSFAFILPLFSAMYYRYYWSALVLIYLLFYPPTTFLTFVLASLGGLFLSFWEKGDQEHYQNQVDLSSKYYQMEELQKELASSIEEVERLSAVAERTRISREIHDNAGHEIVSAYISFQALQNLLENEDKEVVELYDNALLQLEKGSQKIREAVHNMSAVTYMGMEQLRAICENYPQFPVSLNTYGDSSKIPMYIWNVLEACIKESLTNISRHANAKQVQVNLDVTEYMVRLSIENDGVTSTKKSPVGSGLRNLRHRASAVGGNVSVLQENENYQLICNLPLNRGSIGQP